MRSGPNPQTEPALDLMQWSRRVGFRFAVLHNNTEPIASSPGLS
jgi:hypothetical protein